jgi:hypothetical protein
LKMTPPSALAELLRIDAINARLESVANARGTEVFPDIYILTEIYGMGEDEANEVLQLKLQQDQQKMQAEAAAQGAAGGGAPGGMGPAPTGGAAADLGAQAPGEGGDQQGVDMGPEGGPQGGEAGPPGTPEMASVTNRKAINERYNLAQYKAHKAIIEHNMGREKYSAMCESFVRNRKAKIVVKERRSSFDNIFARGEMTGLKVGLKGTSGPQTLTEGLRAISNDNHPKPLTEAQRHKIREARVEAEMARLLVESSSNR